MFKAIFGLKEIEKVRVAQQNESWIKVTITKDWKKIKSQMVGQPSLEENWGFSCCLEIKIEKRQGGW